MRKLLPIKGAYATFADAIRKTTANGNRWMLRSQYILPSDDYEPQSEIHMWLHSTGRLMTVWVHDDGGFQAFDQFKDDGTIDDCVQMAIKNGFDWMKKS